MLKNWLKQPNHVIYNTVNANGEIVPYKTYKLNNEKLLHFFKKLSYFEDQKQTNKQKKIMQWFQKYYFFLSFL